MRNVFIKRLTELAEKNPNIMLLTADLGFGVVEDFAKRFPKQFFNVGVAEQNLIGLSTGLALEGKIVVAYSIANFPTFRCLEQIRNDAAYHGANVKIVTVGAGFSYGPLGFSHHATEDLSILRALPGVTVLSPGDLFEAQEATEAFINTPGPVYFRLDKSSAGWTNKENEQFKIGQARRLREGHDVTLVATGGILAVALQAADTLKTQGISARVLSFHTLKPFDEKSIAQSVQETSGLITIEEHTVVGGLGSAVAEYCLESGNIPDFFYRVGLRDQFSTIVGSQEYLRHHYQMDAEYIVKLVSEKLAGNKTLPRKVGGS